DRFACARFRSHLYSVFFFFQAEDGIRDFHVTGVQTCALPISISSLARHRPGRTTAGWSRARSSLVVIATSTSLPCPSRPSVRLKIGRASCRERVESEGVGG